MLNVDLEGLGTLSNDISNEAGNFKDLLTKINEVNTELEMYWQGQDATKYFSVVKEQAQEMEKLYQTLVECSKYINDAKNAYQEALNANMGQ